MHRLIPVTGRKRPIRFPYYRTNNVRVLNVDGSIAIVSINIPKDKYPLDLIAYYDYLVIDELQDIFDFKYFILNSFLTNNIKHIMFVYDSDEYPNDINDFFDDDDSKYRVYSYDILDNFEVAHRVDVDESKPTLYKHIREQLMNDIQFTTYTRMFEFDLLRGAGVDLDKSWLDISPKAKRPIIDKLLNDFIGKFKNSFTIVRYIDFVNRYYRMSKDVNKSTRTIVRRLYRCDDKVTSLT